MAQVSWIICCEEFQIKENGLCDAKNILFELHTPQVPIVGKIALDIAALWRSENWQDEKETTIRIALVFPDGTVHPSNETWVLNFTSPQVLWYKRITDIYLHQYGYTAIAIQSMEDGDWITKKEFPVMVMGEND